MPKKKYDFKKADNIRVICRFRPSMEHEKREEKLQNLEIDTPIYESTQKVTLARPNDMKKKRFECILDHLFQESTDQASVFQITGKPMVQACLEGYNATIFAYGQTGSGKSWTMFGPTKIKNQEDLGLVQRCCSYLFGKLDKMCKKTGSEIRDWQMTASFIQIYKEHLSDLLDPKKAQRLQIKTNFQTDTPYVENLKKVIVNDLNDLLLQLGEAFSNRVVASHKLNSVSSRSHMLLMLELEQQMKDGSVKKSKLNFGDLAGSEDIRKALGNNPNKERLAEAISINSTLTALTTAIHALSKNTRPSYRSSSLTHILQDSLGGNSKTTMIVNASPHMMNRTETIRTLRFAMTAKTIKNRARVNKLLTRAQLMRRIEELERINFKLKTRVVDLETQMKSAGMNVKISKEFHDELSNDIENDSSDDENEKKNNNNNSVKKSKINGNGIIMNTNNIELKKDENVSISQDVKAKKFEKGDNLRVGQDKQALKFKKGQSVTMEQDNQFNINTYKKEIEKLERKVKIANNQNDSLEKKIEELNLEMDTLSAELTSKREEIESQHSKIKLFGKERNDFEQRITELTSQISKQQNANNKEQKDLDKQIQRQRNNIQTQIKEKKDLQKQLKQLKVENDEVQKENTTLKDQLTSLTSKLKNIEKKNKNNKNNNNNNDDDDDKNDVDEAFKQKINKELHEMELTEAEKNMSGGDLLMHKFASSELSDHRLTEEQRLKKTAKMMDELSTDIGNLMDTWLPKKKVRAKRMKSKQLSLSVRSLIGQFNVLVNQLKMQESNFQNDLKLDLKRRDAEIKKLRQENDQVLQLQDDLAEKDEQIEGLNKQLHELQFERDQLRNQTKQQQDMLMDIKNQVKYLQNENERRNPSLISNDLIGVKDMLNNESKRKKNIKNKKFGGGTGININNGSVSSVLEEEDSDEEQDYGNEEESITGTNMLVDVNSQTIDAIPENDVSSDESDKNEVNNNINNTNNNNNNINKNNNDTIEKKDEKKESVKDEFEMPLPPPPPPNKELPAKPKKIRKDTMSLWRENLRLNDQIDCRDDQGLWWTAKIVGFNKNNHDLLKLRFDGWGEKYDIYVNRNSDRIAYYKSKFAVKRGNTSIVKQGPMYKEGKMFKTWRARYFVLDDKGEISYYHHKNDENPISSFNILDMIKTEKSAFGKNRKYGLTIHTQDRTWKFAVDTEQDVNSWIYAINSVKNRQFEDQ